LRMIFSENRFPLFGIMRACAAQIRDVQIYSTAALEPL